MTGKKNYIDELLLILIFLFGGLWLLKKILKQKNNEPGIFGIKFIRKLVAYVDRNGKRYFDEDLRSFDNYEIGIIIRHIITKAREASIIEYPLFKPFKGTIITGEFRYSQYRIMIYKFTNGDYLMLSLFKKKTDETPKSEIEKAERRLREYISRK